MVHLSRKGNRGWRAMVGVLAMCVFGVVAYADAAPRADDAGVVRVGMLAYGDGKRGECFDDGFLAVVDRESGINVSRRFEPVSLDSDDVFGYPFVVMSGKGRFELSEAQARNLGAFLSRGGFVLASARCSDAAWGDSFVQALEAALPGAELEPLTPEHAVFHTLYDIDRVVTRKATDETAFFGITVGGRLAVVFSPLGVNDAARAGPGCRCCCGNEVRGAAAINANILVYALTH